MLVVVLAQAFRPAPAAPREFPSPLPTARAASEFTVEFRAPDGRVLRGTQYGAGSRWVVLVHDEGEDARAWGPIVRPLSTRGFRVLAFDQRGHGASDGPRSARHTRGDVTAALGFARSRGARTLYVVAAGTGATAALAAANPYVAVRALVALSPRPADTQDAEPVPAETRAPKLIIVGSLNATAGRQADDVFRRSIGFTLLQSQPVEVQGTALLDSDSSQQVREQIVDFLDDYYFDAPDAPY